MLATPGAFEGVAAEPTAIVDEPPIEADKGDWEEEENRGRPRELVWLLDSPGQVTPSKWHPQLVLREPDVENEAELWFVQSYGVGLFEVGVRADEVQGSGANWIHRLGDWPEYLSSYLYSIARFYKKQNSTRQKEVKQKKKKNRKVNYMSCIRLAFTWYE